MPPVWAPAIRIRRGSFFAASMKSFRVRYGELGATRRTSSDWMKPATGTIWSITDGVPCMIGVVYTGWAMQSSVFSSPFLPSTWL